MTANRQRHAWIWVAVAAIAVVTLARAQSDLPQSAALRSALTNPVLQFLSAHSQNDTAATWTRRSVSAHPQRTSHQDSGAWMVFLPILFIGLLTPLSLVSPRTLRSAGHSPSSSFLPFLFQRPPPSFRF